MMGKDVSLFIRAADMAPSGDAVQRVAAGIAPDVLVKHAGHAIPSNGTWMAGAEWPDVRKNNRTGR